MKKSVCLLIILLFGVNLGFSQQNEALKPIVKRPVYFDVSPPLREMIYNLPKKIDNTWKDGVVKNFFRTDNSADKQISIPGFRDAAVQDYFGSIQTDTSIVDFDGLGANGAVPPDTYGDVGPNHYFQVTNLSFAIYNKTGSIIFGPMGNGSVWNGMPNNANSGDAVVCYDEHADRWLFTQFSLPNYPAGPFLQMVAVSQTPDPTGSWYRWEYNFTNMPDYPKFGVWPDGYYMSANRFGTGGYIGPAVAAFDRTAMLSGDPNAQMVEFNPTAGEIYSMLPSDCDGTFPAAGTPNYFTYIRESGTQHLGIYEFHVDWTNTANSTFGNYLQLPVTPFTTLSNGIPQKGSSRLLETLSDRLMYRLQFRQFNGYSAMVLNHTVNAGSGIAGVRWYQLKNTGSGWTISQQSTYAPSDNNSRWMASMAMDTAESIALGYSVSSASIYPQIRYTGRFKSDAPNTMTVTERHIFDGGGSQTGSWSGRSRWGDYSSMTVDPAYPTTFWYTQEYYATITDGTWSTRIGSFTFANAFSVNIGASPDNLCSGVSSQLMALAYGGSGNYTYTWSSIPSGFSSNIKNPVVTPTVTTQYIAVVSDGSQTKHDTTQVKVTSHPTSFAGNDTTVCVQVGIFANHGVATNYRIVLWGSTGDGTFNRPDSVVTNYTPGNHDKTNGTVSLIMMAMPISPCGGNGVQSSKIITFDPCTGIPVTGNEAFNVSVYPNPTPGNILLTITGIENQKATMSLMDINGQTISTENIQGIKNFSRTMDLTGYAKGIYFLKVQTTDHIVTEKVVLQ